MIRKPYLSYQGPTDGHRAGFAFELAGTNDPSELCGIKTVERFTSDGGTALYRVTIDGRLPFPETYGQSLDVTHLDGDDLRVVRVTNALLSGAAVEPTCQFDLGIIDDSEDGAGIKVGYVNNIVTGHRVIAEFFLDVGAP